MELALRQKRIKRVDRKRMLQKRLAAVPSRLFGAINLFRAQVFQSLIQNTNIFYSYRQLPTATNGYTTFNALSLR